MDDKAIKRAEEQAKGLSQRCLIPFGAKPDRDVQFVIGEGRRARDQRGDPVKRSAVTQEEFDAWTNAALFLHLTPDGEGTISTEHGRLLTDPDLRGNIYLKGLLLAESTPSRSASITDKPLKFGYDFASGRTNRERQSVASAKQEARAILAIWSQVLAEKPEMVQELSDMLNTDDPKYADVAGAKSMSFEMASQLMEYICGDEFPGKWYFCEGDKDPRLEYIIEGLGCEAVQLTKTFWNSLREYGLIRTAEEEECRRFTAAPPVAATGTAFAKSVRRLLRACMRACPQTKDMDISFVQAGQLHLQLFFSADERLIRVHGRWLSVDGANMEMGLADDLVEVDILYHTVKRLFADTLEQLPRESFVDEEDHARTAEWRRKLEISRAEQRLMSHLRIGDPDITVQDQDEPGLCATWVEDPRWNHNTTVEIQCHRASRCSYLRDSPLIAEDGTYILLREVSDPLYLF
jgi:hypothetical protein